MLNQVQGDYLANDPKMMICLSDVKSLVIKIKNFRIQQIPWEENNQANILENLPSTFNFSKDRNIPLEFLSKPSTDAAKLDVLQTTIKLTWMDSIAKYLKRGELPPHKLQGCQIQYRLARFCFH